MVDLDPQGNTTSGFGRTVNERSSVYDAMMGRAQLSSCIQDTEIKKLKLIGADISGERQSARGRADAILKDKSGVYVGEFKNDLFNGQGTYTFADGRVYEGKFKDDKFHGQGTMTYPDGTVESGKWLNGDFIG